MSNIIKTWPAKLGIAILIITIFPWEYGIYMFGKLVVFIIAIYYCYYNYQKGREKQNKYFWYFLIALILYNPILPMHLFYRTLWIIMDIILIILFIKYIKDLNSGLFPLNHQIFCIK